MILPERGMLDTCVPLTLTRVQVLKQQRQEGKQQQKRKVRVGPQTISISSKFFFFKFIKSLKYFQASLSKSKLN